MNKLLGVAISMIAMAVDTNAMEMCVNQGEEVPNVSEIRFGYQVSRNCTDGEVGFRITVVQDRVPMYVEVLSSGELKWSGGDDLTFINIAENFISAW